MEGARNGVRKITPPRVYTEVVDGETFTLKQADRPDPDPWDPREYLISRNGEAVLGVQARGTSFYYFHSPKDPDQNHLGYVQHSRRGALLAGALLLTRGIPPPKPELGEGNLRRLAERRTGYRS